MGVNFMNKIKRGLELSGAIVAISVASILTFSCIILLFASDLIDLGLGEINFEKSFKLIVFLFLCLNVAIILIGSFMCPLRIKNSIVSSNTGKAIALLVLVAINFIIYIDTPFFAFAHLCSFGLILSSLFLKHNKIVVLSKPIIQTNIHANNVAETLLEEENVPNENITSNDTVNNNANETKLAKIVDNNNVADIETQLIKLKKLKDEGLIDEQQYKDSVSKILSKI